MNKVILQGRLVADPITTSGDNYMITNFTLAVNRPYKNKETNETTADFIRCVAYNGTAKIISNNLKKGRPLAIVGEWRTGSYTKEDGTNVYTNECRVNEIYFLPGTTDSTNSIDNENSQPNRVMTLNSRTGITSGPVNTVTQVTQPVQQVPIQQTYVQPAQPIQQQFTQSIIAPAQTPIEQAVIPQAFDADIDMSDEFPW